MNNIAVKLDAAGIVENVIVVNEFVPEGYQLVFVPVRIGQGLLEAERIAAFEVAEKSRQAAYASESDPLFFKAQRGEATMEEWANKVAEIKARYPYPSEGV
jgi:hypothetical protein